MKTYTKLLIGLVMGSTLLGQVVNADDQSMPAEQTAAKKHMPHKGQGARMGKKHQRNSKKTIDPNDITPSASAE